ncbi:DUF2652 domain-containing protein [Rufibacter glacialis]|uniref:DUF2652 domain-containing protein n=1 Tax=Rufibacter glacialis TaxID=1259555 RepID=A0A5M8Q5N7_9BACT|nr:DUF2652 domain-containing protein [Rufibacter glacialis]KAA6430214.1 DUF2652 domain-containing protein [Rufibacter glacialis]GGK87395.1 hypothetical protein GCM10011405_38900 [Rufibacter glacialis]
MESTVTNISLAPQGADDSQPALLFIPDISGFTRFMHENGVQYSRNLIADLLEIIIEANILNMEVCEIQGDAILFYKLGDPPAIEQLVSQCKQIFLDFQNYLRIMDRDDHLSGPKLSDNKLTLKIVVHYGRISVTQIRDHIKLMGTDVILAHRLLKNSIEGSEYVLLTEGYLNTQKPEAIERNFEWSQLKDGMNSYEHVGDIRYKYAFLTPLRLLVTDPEADHTHKKYPNTFSVTDHINAPVDLVLRVIQNYRLKPKWMHRVKNAHFDTKKVNRIGTNYFCEMEKGGTIELQMLQSRITEEKIEVIEKMANFKMFPNSLIFYFLYEEDGGTNLTLEFHYSRVSVGDYFYDNFGRKQIKGFMKVSFLRLKALCEKLHRNRLA